jgi:hypothetical protein
MNFLRKIGKWCWDKKERMILVLMLAFLGYRIYTVLYVAESDTSKTFVAPSTDPSKIEDRYGDPPRIIKGSDSADIAPLVRRSLFIYESPGKSSGGNDNLSDEDSRLQVLMILEKPDGAHKAQISTGGKKTLLAEGESFESYQLVSIDIEEQACVIYSENSAKEIVVKVK